MILASVGLGEPGSAKPTLFANIDTNMRSFAGPEGCSERQWFRRL